MFLSGPVTAGVLRGDRARFQLFGDTANAAASVEATGKRGRIHVSQATANLVTKSGEGGWFEKRNNIVNAKGKGPLETCWVKHNFRAREGSQMDRDETLAGDDLLNSSPEEDCEAEHEERLID